MTTAQIAYLVRMYKHSKNMKERNELLAVFPEIFGHLYNLTTKMRLNDLSYIKCIYGPEYKHAKDCDLWYKSFDVDLVNGKAQFNYEGRRFETFIILFEPNAIG